MKEESVKQIEKAHQRLLLALKHVPEDAEIYPGWRKKELIAHIAGWYEEGVDCVPKILIGDKPNSFRLSINGFNKRSVEKRKNKTLDQLLKEMKDLHKKFVKIINKLSENQITDYYGTTLQKKPINVLWVIKEDISHDNNHAKELENIYH